MPQPEPTVDSARILWPCRGLADCSYNGRCDAGSGRCACKPNWTGPRCEQLKLEPVERTRLGYRALDGSGRNVSSWGAPVLWDEASQLWHGWASELREGCGINSWESNSQIVHLVSDSPLGPFERRGVLWPAFAHEPDVTRAPNGTWVMLYSGYALNASQLSALLCTGCADGTTPPPGTPTCPFQRGQPQNLSHPFRQMLATAPGPDGPWRSAEIPQLSMPWDWNTALTILPDDSAIGLIRGGMTWHADKYFEPATWRAVGGVPEGPQLDAFGGVEDPTLWIDEHGTAHMLAHAFRPFFGAHAFSPPTDWPRNWTDGASMNWTFTGVAYGNAVSFTDGSNFSFSRRERPHLVWDKDQAGVTALALSNGVQYLGQLDEPNADATLTLVQPLSTR